MLGRSANGCVGDDTLRAGTAERGRERERLTRTNRFH